jgi:hypothetical protein
MKTCPRTHTRTRTRTSGHPPTCTHFSHALDSHDARALSVSCAHQKGIDNYAPDRTGVNREEPGVWERTGPGRWEFRELRHVALRSRATVPSPQLEQRAAENRQRRLEDRWPRGDGTLLDGVLALRAQRVASLSDSCTTDDAESGWSSSSTSSSLSSLVCAGDIASATTRSEVLVGMPKRRTTPQSNLVGLGRSRSTPDLSSIGMLTTTNAYLPREENQRAHTREEYIQGTLDLGEQVHRRLSFAM